MTVPRPCSICAGNSRESIEAALATGGSIRAVAKRYGTTPSALSRHKRNHPPQMKSVAPDGQPATHVEVPGTDGQPRIVPAAALIPKAEPKPVSLAELVSKLTVAFDADGFIERVTHPPGFGRSIVYHKAALAQILAKAQHMAQHLAAKGCVTCGEPDLNGSRPFCSGCELAAQLVTRTAGNRVKEE